MTSYYFPVGASVNSTKTLVSFSFNAVTASFPRTTQLTVPSASWAGSVTTTPSAGRNGTSITVAECQVLVTQSNFIPLIAFSGSIGAQGPTGSKGNDLTTCPPGTIECTSLTPFLTSPSTEYPNGINASLPSGSRFSKVCMQVPPGCTTPTCPPTLYTGSIPTLP